MARETLQAGRNELCPCGSGKKYKRCCGATEVEEGDASSSFFGIAAAITALMAVIAVVAIARSFLEDAPAQRVWSAEHGHWHTVSGGSGGATHGADDSSTPGPNKVWNEEHGHYHATGGSTEGGPGKVWNEEHGHFHDAGGGEIQPGAKPVESPIEERRREAAEAARQKASQSAKPK